MTQISLTPLSIFNHFHHGIEEIRFFLPIHLTEEERKEIFNPPPLKLDSVLVQKVNRLRDNIQQLNTIKLNRAVGSNVNSELGLGMDAVNGNVMNVESIAIDDTLLRKHGDQYFLA